MNSQAGTPFHSQALGIAKSSITQAGHLTPSPLGSVAAKQPQAISATAEKPHRIDSPAERATASPEEHSQAHQERSPRPDHRLHPRSGSRMARQHQPHWWHLLPRPAANNILGEQDIKEGLGARTSTLGLFRCKTTGTISTRTMTRTHVAPTHRSRQAIKANPIFTTTKTAERNNHEYVKRPYAAASAIPSQSKEPKHTHI